MALSDTIEKMLNDQLNKEFYSAYLYLAISDYYEDAQLTGFENWFYVQAQEERDHAMIIRKYLQDNDARVTLAAINAPGTGDFTDFRKPLTASLAHEEFISGSINDIYAETLRENDFRTKQFLDWFINEQIEEEKNARDLIKRYDTYAKDGKGLYLLDQELGARSYAAAVNTAADA